MSNYTPTLFVSVGETGAYFTLRETYLHYIPGSGQWGNAVMNGVYQGTTEERSMHLFNLGQNPDEALAKAQAHADQMGLALTSTRDGLQDQLRDIKRSNAEEMERREQERLERVAQWEAERKADIEKQLAVIAQGVYPFGRYTSRPFREADAGYINWLMDNAGKFDDELMAALADAVKAECADLALPTLDPEATIGKPKQRLEMAVTVVKRAEFHRERFNGYGMEQVNVITMATADGVCVVSMSPAFSADVGEKLRIKATVKAHNDYKGQAQTMVNRVKVLG